MPNAIKWSNQRVLETLVLKSIGRNCPIARLVIARIEATLEGK